MPILLHNKSLLSGRFDVKMDTEVYKTEDGKDNN